MPPLPQLVCFFLVCATKPIGPRIFLQKIKILDDYAEKWVNLRPVQYTIEFVTHAGPAAQWPD